MRDRILATLAYYDGFDYPLKAAEVLDHMVSFRHLGENENKKADIRTVIGELNSLVQSETAGHRGEYYFLFEREYLVPLRERREIITKKKINKTLDIMRWVRHIPFVQLVFASGSLSMRNTSELSDLDIFVVTKNGRIWLTTALMLLTFEILGSRRLPRHKLRRQMCANHFITDKSLQMKNKSIFTAQLFSQLLPIYVADKSLLNRFENENKWVKKYVNIFDLRNKKLEKNIKKSLISKSAEFVLSGIIGRVLNDLAKRYQVWSIKRNARKAQKDYRRRGRVIYNDYQLEFHPSSVEPSLIRKYNEKLTALGLGRYAKEKDSGLTKGV